MMGPGYGHNIEPYLEYFNENTEKYTFKHIYWGKLDFKEKFPNIDFIKLNRNNLNKIYKLISSSNDIIWQHGNNIILYAFVKLFKSRKTMYFLNIWSDRLYLTIKNSLLKRIVAKIVLNNAFIHCYWYTTTKNLQTQIPNANYATIDCGMHKDIFVNETIDTSKLSSEFNKLMEEVNTFSGKRFFYPKSMTDASGHDLILEAAKKLLDNGIDDFTVIFRRGNEVNNLFEDKIRKKINKYHLDNHVKLQQYSYLSFYELAHLWKAMDCGLQIAYHDQLSTTFLEPMLFKKEIIATDIESYRIYKDTFNVNLELSDITVDSIFEKMRDICLGIISSEDVLLSRKKVVEDNFYFDKNVQSIIDYYSRLNN